MQDIPVISLWMVLVASKRQTACVKLCLVYCIIGFTERVKVQLWMLLQNGFELLLSSTVLCQGENVWERHHFSALCVLLLNGGHG